MTRLSVYEPDRVCNTHGNIFAPTRVGIQAALDDLDARGGGVYLPPIEIPIDTTITATAPYEGVTILSTGGSKGGTWDLGCVLKLNDSVNLPIMTLGSAVAATHRIILEGFAWDGNKGNNSSPAANDNDGVQIERAEGCVVKNCVGYNCYNNALLMGTSAQIQSKSTIENSIFSTNGDNGIKATAQEDWKAYGVHTGSNGGNGSTARGMAGINATAQLVDIGNCLSIYDQEWLNLRGDRNVISNCIVDKPYVSVMHFFSADGVHVENLQCHDVSYTNNNSPAFDFDGSAHGEFFFDRVTVEQGGGADLPTYIFDLSAGSCTVELISIGQRSFEYQTDIFNGYPTDVNIAPTMECAVAFDTDPGGTPRYMPLQGIYTPAAARTGLQIFFQRRKLVSDLYWVLDVAPGVGDSRTVTLEEAGASQALTDTITGAATTGNDTTNYVEVAAGNYLNWELVEVNAPAASTGAIYCKVNDLEDVF